MVRGVAVQRGGLQREGKAGRGWVNLRGGTQYSEAGETALISQEKVERRETGLDGQYVDGGAGEAVGRPPLELMPEGGELPGHVGGGHEDVRTVTEDGEEKRGGQPVAQKRREADPWGGEPFDGHEGSLGLGQSFGEVGRRGERRGKPVAHPSDLGWEGWLFFFFFFNHVFIDFRYKKQYGALAMTETKPINNPTIRFTPSW